MSTINRVGVYPSQIFAGPPSLPLYLLEQRGGCQEWDRGSGVCSPPLHVPHPNHQSSSCPPTSLADPCLLCLYRPPDRQPGRWRRKERRRAQGVTMLAVQPFGHRVYVCVFACSTCGCVCVCVSPHPVCMCQRDFFLFLRTRRFLGECVRVCVCMWRVRERAWALKRQRSRFREVHLAEACSLQTPTSQICCS